MDHAGRRGRSDANRAEGISRTVPLTVTLSVVFPASTGTGASAAIAMGARACIITGRGMPPESPACTEISRTT